MIYYIETLIKKASERMLNVLDDSLLFMHVSHALDPSYASISDIL